MALFNLKKKSEPKPCSCNETDCCSSDTDCQCDVKVLGGGCKNCHALMDNAKEALRSLGMDDCVQLVSDMPTIASYGVMSTPALVVDGKVLSSGRVLTTEQAKEAIAAARSAQAQ